MAAGRGAGRVLVVGQHSFIARHFLAACEQPVTAVGHDAIDRPDLFEGVDRVISFARHPLLGSEDYRPATMDPDLRLAERVAGRGIDYVMLSSRKVYAPSARPLAETDPTGPQELYGRHKLAVEDALRARLGARLTILRLANIFGYERGHSRRTFFSLTLERLAHEGRIRFDMSPFVDARFSAGRGMRAPARADRRRAARRRAQRRLGHRRADRTSRALGARRLWRRRAGDRIAARARRLRARCGRAHPTTWPALHLRRAARELHRAWASPRSRRQLAELDSWKARPARPARPAPRPARAPRRRRHRCARPGRTWRRPRARARRAARRLPNSGQERAPRTHRRCRRRSPAAAAASRPARLSLRRVREHRQLIRPIGQRETGDDRPGAGRGRAALPRRRARPPAIRSGRPVRCASSKRLGTTMSASGTRRSRDRLGHAGAHEHAGLVVADHRIAAVQALRARAHGPPRPHAPPRPPLPDRRDSR